MGETKLLGSALPTTHRQSERLMVGDAHPAELNKFIWFLIATGAHRQMQQRYNPNVGLLWERLSSRENLKSRLESRFQKISKAFYLGNINTSYMLTG